MTDALQVPMLYVTLSQYKCERFGAFQSHKLRRCNYAIWPKLCVPLLLRVCLEIVYQYPLKRFD